MPIESTRDPESMTEAERRDEVGSILGRGLVRAVSASRACAGFRSDPAPTCLDLPGDLRLSVAPRPGG